MPSVFSVADYVLSNAGSMTTMKLQKLVYYCQAYSLAWDETPLFDNDFEAWANGPVCRELFASHHGVFRIGAEEYSAHKCKFSPAQQETMNAVIEAYSDKEPNWLIALTHSERPWLEARKGIAPGAPSTNVISKETMQDYYGGLNGE